MAIAPDTVLQGPRVLLRHWRPEDLAPFAAMNASPQVMRHFLAPLGREQSDAMAERLAAHQARRGYSWWVLQLPQAAAEPGLAFAGCVGLIDVPFALPGHLAGVAQPPVEIGWRLVPAAWGRGLATEAARLVLGHARDALGLAQVVSFTAVSNTPSVAVMQRIGMAEIGRFEHPRIEPGHALRPHVLYSTAWP